MTDIYRQAPDGHMMAFPQGTPPEEQDRQMQSYWDTRAAPDTSGGQGTAVLPQGAQASGIQPQEGAPDPRIISLSPQAQMYKGLLMQQTGPTGTRQGAQAINSLMHTEPSIIAQDEASKKMGALAADIAAKQAAGTRVYKAVNDLQQKAQAWEQHAPNAFNAAIGPWNSNQHVQDWTGWMNQGGADFDSMKKHDFRKLVALYREMPSTGRSAGSDAQDANFYEAMGAAERARDPATFFGILESAKDLIRKKSALPDTFDVPHTALDPTDIAAVNRYAHVNPIGPNSVNKYTNRPFADPSYFNQSGSLRPDAKRIYGEQQQAGTQQPQQQLRLGSTRDHPIPVHSLQEALRYPSGTYVQTPVGLKQVP